MTVLWGSRAIRNALVKTLAWCVYAIVPMLVPSSQIGTDSVIDAAVIFALGLLMTVRLNRSYERWWEARTLWGTLVNASRNLAVKIAVYARPEPEVARSLHGLISGFAYGLRDHLRGGARLAGVPGFEKAEADPRHVPSYLVARLTKRFAEWTEESKRILPEGLRMLDLESRIFLDVCGACERIRNTPLPAGLTAVTRIALATFLVGMPWLLKEELGWWVIPVAGIASFLFIVAETISTALEHPFGTELDQLDLTGIVGEIEASTGEILGVRA